MNRVLARFMTVEILLLSVVGVLGIIPIHAAADFTLANKFVVNGVVSTNLGIPDGGIAQGYLSVSNLVSEASNSISFSYTLNVTQPDITVNFLPSPVILPTSTGSDVANTTVSISVGPLAPHGAYNLTMAATNGVNTHIVSFFIKVYSIAITVDAQNTGPTDVTPTPSFSPSKSFSVGVMVANATTTGGTGAKCTVAFPCGLTLYGFQFGLTYDPTVLVPQGDPNPAATPGNSAGLYVDGAANTVTYGGQTSIGEGTASFASIAAAGNAFPVSQQKSNEILVAYTLKAPIPAAFLASSTGRFLLASVSFEILRRPASPTILSLSSSDLAFADARGAPSCNCVFSTSPGQGQLANETITNAPPTAKFTATTLAIGDSSCKTVYSFDTSSGCSAYSFKFDASASTGSSALTYTWDFGDGSRDSASESAAACPAPDADLNCSQGVTVVHDFAAAAALGGTPTPPAGYTVTLRVTDASGATGSARDLSGNPIANNQPSHYNGFAIANLSPTASFTFTPSAPVTGQGISFDASTSTDDADGIGAYTWNFGDSSPIVTNAAPMATAVHSYANPGTYTVTLTATDTLGANGTTTRVVTVALATDFTLGLSQGNLALTIGSPSNSTGTVRVTLSSSNGFTGTASLSETISPGGAGSPTVTLNVTSILIPPGGSNETLLLVSTTTLGAQPTLPGLYAVNVTATSGTHSHSTILQVLVIKPPDRPPLAIFTFTPSSPSAGVQVTFDGSASFDPDGTIINWAWSFGDGTFASSSPVVGHVYNSACTCVVTLTVTDNGGLSTSVSETLTVQPRPTHDVGIVNIFTPGQVVQTQIAYIYVVVTNLGTQPENVSVAVFYDSNLISNNSFFVYPGLDEVPVVWDTTNVSPGNYTISATVYLATDQNPSNNHFTDGTITVEPPPSITINPASGMVGTQVVVHGTGFPGQFGEVFISFDDNFLGFAFPVQGRFTFTLNVPFADPARPHQIVVHDVSGGTSARTGFKLLPTPAPALSVKVSIDTGAIYFPGDSAVVYVQTSLNGSLIGPSGIKVQVKLLLPNGNSVVLTTSSISPGIFKAGYGVPALASVGTYEVVVTVNTISGFNGTSTSSFLVKPTWLNGRAMITGGLATVGIAAVLGIAWWKGYLRDDETEHPRETLRKEAQP